jgi:predicted kinase
MREAGMPVEGEGYSVAYAIAEDNLRLGRIVIADCVNPWPLTRDAWRSVADRAGARAVEVEIVCSDRAEHRRRVESRAADIPWPPAADVARSDRARLPCVGSSTPCHRHRAAQRRRERANDSGGHCVGLISDAQFRLILVAPGVAKRL